MNFELKILSKFPLQHHVDPAIGVYIIDRYTYYALEFLENVDAESQRTIGEFVSNSGYSASSTLFVKNLFYFSRMLAEGLPETSLHFNSRR